jgi:hypothetical protein
MLPNTPDKDFAVCRNTVKYTRYRIATANGLCLVVSKWQSSLAMCYVYLHLAWHSEGLDG